MKIKVSKILNNYILHKQHYRIKTEITTFQTHAGRKNYNKKAVHWNLHHWINSKLRQLFYMNKQSFISGFDGVVLSFNKLDYHKVPHGKIQRLSKHSTNCDHLSPCEGETCLTAYHLARIQVEILYNPFFIEYRRGHRGSPWQF